MGNRRKFLVTLIFLPTLNLVSSQRSSSSASSAETSGGPASSTSSSSGTSLLPTHREKDLISAQFRAIRPDARDLDTSDPPSSGLESLGGVGQEMDDHLAITKYMAASASAYAPAKMRLNKYAQTGFYDPYPSYAGAYNSVPSSYYPYNGYGYRDSNPLLDTYPYYERDRMREIRERAMHASQSAPYGTSLNGSSNRDGYGSIFGGFRSSSSSSHYDNQAMSSGGHDHNEHGGGWGPPKEYTSKVNTNAIGLLGLLGLLSLLSNVLLQFTTTTTTTTTAAAGRRRKRSLGLEEEDVVESKEHRMERIFMEILPHLTPVAHVKDGLLPMECTFHGVCMTNRVLVNELGAHGRPAGIRISRAIVKLLDKIGVEGNKHHLNPFIKNKDYYLGKDLKKSLEMAGLHGRNKKDCERSYPVCNALRARDAPALPFIIRMQDLPHLVDKVSKLPHGVAVPMNL